jgi:hypothetical protein
MRAICPCSRRLEGATDEEFIRFACEHVDSHHPDIERSDEKLRGLVAAGSYDN